MKRKIIISKYRIKKFKGIKKFKKKSTKKYNTRILKIILILILLIIFIIDNIIRKKNPIDIIEKKNPIEYTLRKEDGTQFMIEFNGKKELIDPSKLSLSDHYKILLPRIKYHPPHKKIKLEDVFKYESSYDLKRKKETGKDKYYYHTCICAMGKYENVYLREYVEYYLSIGVEKFYFGDDNPDNVENFEDALYDYVKKGVVEIEYIHHLNVFHNIFVQQVFENAKFRCKWFIFIDYDEFLVFSDKNMNVQTYLDMPVLKMSEYHPLY